MKNGKFDYMKFAAHILSKRTDESISFRAMAEKAGVSISTCHRAEAAGGGLTVDNVIAICNWLDMTVQYFLTPKPAKNGKGKKGARKG